MNTDQRLEYAERFRAARAALQSNAEAFVEVARVVEDLGTSLALEKGLPPNRVPIGMGSCRKLVRDALFPDPACWNGRSGTGTTSIARLFEQVRIARNAAVHEGAHSRTAGEHAAELAMALETALMKNGRALLSDWMVRDPVVAKPWHTVVQVRATLLKRGFDALPIWMDWKEDCEKGWYWVTAYATAVYLLEGAPEEKTIKDAESHPKWALELEKAGMPISPGSDEDEQGWSLWMLTDNGRILVYDRGVGPKLIHQAAR